jgi:uncharacterized repeat protein (TIGR03803 family)
MYHNSTGVQLGLNMRLACQRLSVLAFIWAILSFVSTQAHAQTATESTLYTFCSQENCYDGQNPTVLLQGSDGNFYGVTPSGGVSGNGTVYKLTAAGIFTTIYSFCTTVNCTDGYVPDALIEGADGNFYGLTESGVVANSGTLFKITPTGTLTTLYTFNASSGTVPTSLVLGSDGNFYGTTSTNGAGTGTLCSSGCGTIFRFNPSSKTLTVLHSFDGTDGAGGGALLQGSDGNFYGVSGGGGSSNYGTLFKISAPGNFTSLHSFTAGTNDGGQPNRNRA